MDFAKELIRKKIVPLGFSYNGLVVIIRKKIENGELQKKKDLYQFLSHYLVLHQSDKVLEIINQYTYIYTSVHKEKNILRTNKNYHGFLQQLFLCYLKQDQIDVGLVRYQYLQNLVLEYSFQRRLEKIYARNLKELKDIIACLSSEEKIKIRGFYNFQKDHRIEIKISYGFSFLILARIMKDDSLNLKKELSYSAFDETYVKYYQIFLDKMGLSLNHIKQICSFKQNQEKLAYVFQYQKYDGKYPVDEVVRAVEDAIRKIQQMEYLSLESLVSNEKEEFIQGIFLYLKQAQPEYYRAILNFGDLSLKEYNNLSMSEKKLYRDATAKMTEIIAEVKTSPIWHEMINVLMKDRKIDFFGNFLKFSKRDVLLSLEQLKEENLKYYAVILKHHGDSLGEWHALTSSENAIYLIAMFHLQKILQKSVITLFDKFPGTPRQEALRVLEQMKDDRPQYYAIIYKRHGDSLEEWRELVRDENVIYRNAINSMRTRLQKSVITLFDKFLGMPRQEVLRVLEQMKDDNPRYYAIIYKRHGDSLEEWHELTSDENVIYRNAISSMRTRLQKPVITLFDKFPGTPRQEALRVLEQMKDNRPKYYAIIYKRHGKSLEEWYELTSDECTVYASAISSMRVKLQKSVTTLFDKFPETSRQEVLRVLEQMKDDRLQYYAIIYKRHGKSLEEWHELTSDECTIYSNAINSMRTRLQKSVTTLFDKFSETSRQEVLRVLEQMKDDRPQYYAIIYKRHGKSLEEWRELTSDECIVYASAINSMRAKLQKSVTTLFDKFSETSRQEVLRVLEQMKDDKPQYYAIIYKRHGESLEEWHELARDECHTYFLSIEYLKRKIQYQGLVKKEIYSEVKEILKGQKEQLFLVRDIRNGLLTQEIHEKYHLSFSEIFDFYFQTLLLYDEETVIRIIYECFLYHCQNKLLQSSYYQLLLERSSNTDNERILNQVVSQLELQGVEVRNTNKYIRRKKKKKD